MTSEELIPITDDTAFAFWEAKNRHQVENGVASEGVPSTIAALRAAFARAVELASPASLLLIALKPIAADIHANKVAKGWTITTPEAWDDPNQIPADLALIHSEVSEALEAFRKGDQAGFAKEMADIFIRLVGLVHGLKIDLPVAVVDKMAVNRERPVKHGGLKL